MSNLVIYVESVGGAIIGRISNVDDFRSEGASDVMPDVVIGHTRYEGCLYKAGESRSNRSRDMRLPQFVTNDDDDDDTCVCRSS